MCIRDSSGPDHRLRYFHHHRAEHRLLLWQKEDHPRVPARVLPAVPAADDAATLRHHAAAAHAAAAAAAHAAADDAAAAAAAGRGDGLLS